jgi:predicted transcriptional regulator
MAEYNAMIDEALAAQRAGEYISHEDLEKEILTWR